ncbi:MAG: hypothetical protein ACYC5Y_08630 [Symbiobacteriia bacterium]
MSNWKKRAWLRLASTALVAIMIVGGAASTGAAKDNQPTLSGPSVVTRDTTTLPPLKDVERVILQGKKTESGYVFDFVLHKAADELPKVLRPIAVDPVKGVVLVEIGHDPNPTVEPTEGETLAEVAKADNASSGDAVRVYYDSAYFFNTVFAAAVLGRPAYTDVSYSNITVVGYFDGSSDGYGSAVPGGDLASWLSASYRLE